MAIRRINGTRDGGKTSTTLLVLKSCCPPAQDFDRTQPKSSSKACQTTVTDATIYAPTCISPCKNGFYPVSTLVQRATKSTLRNAKFGYWAEREGTSKAQLRLLHYPQYAPALEKTQADIGYGGKVPRGRRTVSEKREGNLHTIRSRCRTVVHLLDLLNVISLEKY